MHTPLLSVTSQLTTSDSKPKAQPKSAAVTKTRASETTRSERGRGRRGRNAGRNKPKTLEELDAEMDDYHDVGPSNGATDNGAGNVSTGQAAPVVNGGDMGIDDEIMVSRTWLLNLCMLEGNVADQDSLQ